MLCLHYLPALFRLVVSYNEDSFVNGYNQDTPESLLKYYSAPHVRTWLSDPATRIDAHRFRSEGIRTSGVTIDLCKQRPVLYRFMCNQMHDYINVIQRLQSILIIMDVTS